MGRLFPGICFRMVPFVFFSERMREYSECEMLRCPLEKIVLKIKKLDQLERDIMSELEGSHNTSSLLKTIKKEEADINTINNGRPRRRELTLD